MMHVSLEFLLHSPLCLNLMIGSSAPSNVTGNASNDPITDYLTTAAMPHIDDPIKYWSSFLDGGHPLARMALDVLSMPGKSFFRAYFSAA